MIDQLANGDITKLRRKSLSGVSLAILGTFLFACKSIVIKLAFTKGADPTVVLSLRMLLALPFYVVVLAKLRGLQACVPAITHSQVFQAVTLGFLGYYLASYLDICGLQFVSAKLE